MMARHLLLAVTAWCAGGCALVAGPASAQPAKWDAFPTMQLERVYRGPLRDTVVQRWRDPIDGSVCYLFIPMSQEYAPANDSGYVQYGPNAIGSISCVGVGSAAQGTRTAKEALPDRQGTPVLAPRSAPARTRSPQPRALSGPGRAETPAIPLPQSPPAPE
jgi:hypothetical protein